jgi:hypothetical protein
MTVPLARFLYAALLLIGLVFLWTAGSFPEAQSPNDIGPAAFPRWLAAAMIVLIAADLVLSWRQTRRVALSDLGLAAVVACGMVAMIWAAGRFGFFVVLPPALFAGLWLAGSRSLIANAAYSILFPAVIWALFVHLLQLPIDSM